MPLGRPLLGEIGHKSGYCQAQPKLKFNRTWLSLALLFNSPPTHPQHDRKSRDFANFGSNGYVLISSFKRIKCITKTEPLTQVTEPLGHPKAISLATILPGLQVLIVGTLVWFIGPFK